MNTRNTPHHLTSLTAFKELELATLLDPHATFSAWPSTASVIMKAVMPYFVIVAAMSFAFWPTLSTADEPKFTFKGEGSLNDPTDEESFDAEEFVALKFLSKTKAIEVDDLLDVERHSRKLASDYLISKWFGQSENVFEEKRAVAKLDTALNDENGPGAAAEKIEYIKINVTEHVSQDYDFAKSAFPFTPDAGGRGNSKEGLFDGNMIFAIELFPLSHLPIGVEKGEKWLTGDGKVFAVCKLGKEFNLRQHGIMQAIKVRCEKIVFESKDGEVLTQFGAPAPFGEVVPEEPLSEVVPDTASSNVDPVGQWTTKARSPEFSLCLWESGDARGEFDGKDLAIYLDGKWHVIKEGKWKGYVIFSGRVEYWGIGRKAVTPKDEKFEFLLSLADNELNYIKGGLLTDKNGGKFYPSGIQANDDPILHKQNSSRPIRREPGNR